MDSVTTEQNTRLDREESLYRDVQSMEQKMERSQHQSFVQDSVTTEQNTRLDGEESLYRDVQSMEQKMERSQHQSFVQGSLATDQSQRAESEECLYSDVQSLEQVRSTRHHSSAQGGLATGPRPGVDSQDTLYSDVQHMGQGVERPRYPSPVQTPQSTVAELPSVTERTGAHQNGAVSHAIEEIKRRLVGNHHHHHDQYSKNHGKRMGKLRVVLASISLSVGVGNAWRFPSLMAAGGGASFLLVYVIVLLIVGLPLYYLELALGQFSSCNSAKVWKVLPILKGIRYGQMVLSFFLVVYIIYVMGVCVYLIIPLFEYSNTKYIENSTCHEYVCMNMDSNCSLALWKYEAVKGNSTWKNMCSILEYLLIWLVFTLIVTGVGFSSPSLWFNKVRYVLFTAAFIGLISLLVAALVIRGKEGAKGITEAVFQGEWKSVKNITVWYNACEQVLFSLGISFGHVITMSSKNAFENNVLVDVLFVSVVDTLTSFLCACVVFSILPTVDYINYLKEAKLNSEDWYVMYRLSDDTPAGYTLSSIYYAIVFAFGLATVVVYMKSAFDFITKESWKKHWLSLSTGTIVLLFLFTIPLATNNGQVLFSLLETYGVGVPLFIICIIQTFGLMYGYGWRHFFSDVSFMIGSQLRIYWKLCWLIVSPGILFLIFIWGRIDNFLCERHQHSWTLGCIGWSLSCLTVLQVPLWAIIACCKAPEWGWIDRLEYIFKPQSDWGPSHPYHRRKWLNEKDRQRLRAPLRLAYTNPTFQSDSLRIHRIQDVRPGSSYTTPVVCSDKTQELVDINFESYACGTESTTL